MKEILANLANWMLVKYCIENNIDCSDSHIVKEPKPFTYSLNKSNGHQIIKIQFHKHAAPSYYPLSY